MPQDKPRGDGAEAAALDPDGGDLDRLYRAELGWLERALRRHLPNPDDRAEAAQETFCRVARYGWPEAVAHPRALLFKIALNIVRADAKSTRRRLAAAERPLEAADAAALAAWAAEKDDLYTLAALRQALDELPPKCRQVFLLHRAKGMKHAEIAEALGVSIKAVENHMMKANRIFRQRLGKADEGR